MKYQGDHLASFSKQIEFAYNEYQKNPFQPSKTYSNLVICGLGGSGIAGRLVSNYVSSTFSLPIAIVSDYNLPALATANSLIICCSYSGNTEETISCFNEATALGADCIVLSGGGKMQELAKKHGATFYLAQLGYQPRMALGYPITYLLCILNALHSSYNFISEIPSAISKLSQVDNYKAKAADMFEAYKSLAGNVVEILADGPLLATATRFQQQLNENPKVTAFVHPMPEMCHNVIESFTSKTNHFYLLLDSTQNARNTHRMLFNNSILEEKGNTTLYQKVELNSITDLLEWNFVLDWFSLYCADYLNIVSSNIPNIVALKESLSRV